MTQRPRMNSASPRLYRKTVPADAGCAARSGDLFCASALFWLSTEKTRKTPMMRRTPTNSASSHSNVSARLLSRVGVPSGTGRGVPLPDSASATLSYSHSSMAMQIRLSSLLHNERRGELENSSSFPELTHPGVLPYRARSSSDCAHAVVTAPRDRVSRFCRSAHEGTFLGSVFFGPDQVGTFMTGQTRKGKPFHRGSDLPSSFW